MPASFYYLISSLPLLHLGQDIPMTSEEFLDYCRGNLSSAGLEKLAAVSIVPDGSPRTPVEEQWQEWETCFRNFLTRQRCREQGEKPEQWLRHEAAVFPGVENEIEDAFAADDPASRQMLLDEIRWRQLDHLAVYHPFDFEALVIYRLRLLLAEEWAVKTTEEGFAQLEDIVNGIIEKAEEVRNNS